LFEKKLLPYILFHILALKMASPGNGTVPVVSAHCRSLWVQSALKSGKSLVEDYICSVAEEQCRDSVEISPSSDF